MTDPPVIVIVDEPAITVPATTRVTGELGYGEVIPVDTVADARATVEREPNVGCVVCGSGGSESDELELVADLRSTAPTTPVVLFSDGDTSVEAALDAGADDVVTGRDERTDDAYRLLARRIDALVSAEEPHVDRHGSTALRALTGLDESDAVAVFDEDFRHTFVAGESVLMEGERVTDIPGGAAGAYLESDYRATLDGESRSRQRSIEDTLYRIDTTPLAGDGRTVGGLVRFTELERVSETTPSEAETNEKVERLHDITSELDTLDSVTEILELAVDSANRVLQFDACSISERSDGRIVLRAAATSDIQVGAEVLDEGDGIAGRTIREGRTFLVDDIGDHPEARPTEDSYQSVLSIPLGDDNVFQAISTNVGAFTETDRELAELLCTHVQHAVERVEFESLLTQERDRFAALFENVPDAAVRYVLEDGVPRIEAVNAAFVRLFGYDPDDAIGRPVESLLVPDSESESAAEQYQSIAAGAQLDREVERLTVDGSRPFLLRNVPFSDADSTEGYLIYTDIADLKEREQLLERKNERLERFTSIVSHDLRNPLSIATGYVETMLDSGEMTYAEETAEELDRMDRMVSELLTLAREGEIIGQTETVDVGAVATEAWTHVETEGADLQLDDLPSIEANSDRLSELFENCFRNSVEHGSASGQTAADDGSPSADGDDHAGETLTVTVGGLDGTAGFYVADDGPGIPEAERETVFEYGYSTANSGTGFGLAIVEEIANAHDWSANVTESESGGARLEFHTESGGEI